MLLFIVFAKRLNIGFFKANKLIDGYSQLTIGMYKQKVISLLGESSGRKVRENEEILIWTNSEFKDALRGGTVERRIEVTFEDERVIGYDEQNMSSSAW